MSGCGAGACSSSVRSVSSKYPIYCDESVMSQKEHGTCTQPLMKNLRWGVDWSTADKICCFNRHFAEYSGYFTTTQFMNEKHDEPITFYDPIGGKPLFIAPQGRTWKERALIKITVNQSEMTDWSKSNVSIDKGTNCIRATETGIHARVDGSRLAFVSRRGGCLG